MCARMCVCVCQYSQLPEAPKTKLTSRPLSYSHLQSPFGCERLPIPGLRGGGGECLWGCCDPPTLHPTGCLRAFVIPSKRFILLLFVWLLTPCHSVLCLHFSLALLTSPKLSVGNVVAIPKCFRFSAGAHNAYTHTHLQDRDVPFPPHSYQLRNTVRNFNTINLMGDKDASHSLRNCQTFQSGSRVV